MSARFLEQNLVLSSDLWTSQGILCSCQKEGSTSPCTDSSAHIYLAGNAMLRIAPVFKKQNPCFVVGWAAGGDLKDEHQTQFVPSAGWDCGERLITSYFPCFWNDTVFKDEVLLTSLSVRVSVRVWLWESKPRLPGAPLCLLAQCQGDPGDKCCIFQL